MPRSQTLSTIRVPMGLNGLTRPNRTYNDMPSGQTDPKLSQFSIAGDLEWKVPLMRQAKSLNPELTLMGTPWSAPAWMKTSGKLGYGKLNPTYYGVYAQYFTKWLDAWRAQGLGISAVTMQNEPHHEPYSYQGMRMEPAEQVEFANSLGPALRAAGHSTRILTWAPQTYDSTAKFTFPADVPLHSLAQWQYAIPAVDALGPARLQLRDGSFFQSAD